MKKNYYYHNIYDMVKGTSFLNILWKKSLHLVGIVAHMMGSNTVIRRNNLCVVLLCPTTHVVVMSCMLLTLTAQVVLTCYRRFTTRTPRASHCLLWTRRTASVNGATTLGLHTGTWSSCLGYYTTTVVVWTTGAVLPWLLHHSRVDTREHYASKLLVFIPNLFFVSFISLWLLSLLRSCILSTRSNAAMCRVQAAGYPAESVPYCAHHEPHCYRHALC